MFIVWILNQSLTTRVTAGIYAQVSSISYNLWKTEYDLGHCFLTHRAQLSVWHIVVAGLNALAKRCQKQLQFLD